MINLIHGDCLEKMKNIPDKSIDMVLTDPPYRLKSGGRVGNKTPRGGVFTINNGDLKSGKFFTHNDIDFSEWLPEAYRIMREDSHCLVFINNHNLFPLLATALKLFKLKNILVWNKGNKNAHRNYMLQVEFIVLLGKGRCRGINSMGSANLLNFKNKSGGKLHPTQKPIDLLEHLISNSSDEGDLVLDLFMGSGSTGVACKNLNRNFIGIEKDDNYFEIARNRINAS